MIAERLARRALEGRTRPAKPIIVFLSLALASASLTVMYLSMRAVMAIGGFCASGGPFVIETQCPEHVAPLMFGAAWIGIIAVGFYAVQVSQTEVPSVVALFWPALFLSLGWNFLDFGIWPPPPNEGIIFGWLLCGVIFVVMGLPPAIWWVSRLFKGNDTRTTREEVTTRVLGAITSLRDQAETMQEHPASDFDMDITGELERLAALHTSGALTAAEYRAAKRKVIGS